MTKTREKILESIAIHKEIISAPASNEEMITASRIAIQALEYDLQNSGDSWGAASIPIIRTHGDFESLKREALLGCSASQCAVADICADYNRTEFYNPNEATYWYEKAAEQGHKRAQWLLGTSYLQGTGVEIDLAKAEYWLLSSAQNGDADGQYTLGGFYFMKPDLVKAEYWLEKAVNQGHIEAEAALEAVKLLLKTYI